MGCLSSAKAVCLLSGYLESDYIQCDTDEAAKEFEEHFMQNQRNILFKLKVCMI